MPLLLTQGVKVKSRYHLGNDTKFIEFSFDAKGLAEAKNYRQNHPEFKGRHIRNILQAYESIVYVGREYSL